MPLYVSAIEEPVAKGEGEGEEDEGGEGEGEEAAEEKAPGQCSPVTTEAVGGLAWAMAAKS